MTEKKEKRMSRRPFIDTSRVQPIHVYIDRPKHRHRIPTATSLVETLQCKARLSEDKEALILEPIQELSVSMRYLKLKGSIIAELDEETSRYFKPEKETEPEKIKLEDFVYGLRPVRKLKRLLRGDVKTTKLALMVPLEFNFH